MSFSSPLWLLGLLLLPLALAAYQVNRARARRYALRFTAVSTLRLALGSTASWLRHLPAALLLGAVAALVLGLARPHITTHVASGRASVMIVTDHSGSMQATDVQPTRLAAAQRAARTFIDALPGQARVGVVTFGSQPDAVQAPTSNRGAVINVIESQSAVGATDTGDALQLALDLLRQDAAHPPSAIVLLSDGATTTGPDPVAVASTAARDKIPVYTVALGTPGAAIPDPAGTGVLIPVPPDPQLLARIAEASNGRAFTAQDEGQLISIYRRLGSQLGRVARSRDLTPVFLVVGLVSLLGAGVLAQRGRVLA